MDEAVKMSANGSTDDEGVVVEGAVERLALQPPPAGRSRGEPMAGHWRREGRRLSDVIDSGVPSPAGPSPRTSLGSFFGASFPAPPSPHGPAPGHLARALASSLPKDLPGAAPRSPRSPLAPASPASDRGYGGSAFSSPMASAAPATLAAPSASAASAAPAGARKDSLDAVVANMDEPLHAAPTAAVGVPDIQAPMFVEKDAAEYNMTHARRGRAVIIHNNIFDSSAFTVRTGSEQDVKNLESAFEFLQFEVTTHNNKTYQEISNIMRALAVEDHSDADCLVVTVLTHGLSGGFLLSKDIPYLVQHIWQLFTPDQCPTLAGKPKLFFIQACRGEGLDKGVILTRQTQTDSGAQSYKIPTHADFMIAYSAPEEACGGENLDENLGVTARRLRTETDSLRTSGTVTHNYRIPIQADFLVAYSVMEGHFSWRNPEEGTWFIQCLSEELKANGRSMELLRLLTRVSRHVAVGYESMHEFPWMHQCKQVPQFTSMLIRDVYFRRKE